MSFITTHRPSTLGEVAGNATTLKRLSSILAKYKETGKLDNQVFLFDGMTGCGKTTLGRIMASELNDGDISDQNVMEINCGLNRGVDDIRAIEETAHLQPMHGNFRVFLLDEIQELTPQAMKGLLKVTEDVAAHTVFILCSMDPGKLPKALIDRASRFQVSFPSREDFKPLVTRICKAEGMTMNKEVFDLLIRNSSGTVRSFVQHLDAIHQLGASTTEELAEVVIGYFNQDTGRYDSARSFLKAKDISGRMAVIGTVDNGFDFTTTLLDVCAQEIDKHHGDVDHMAVVQRIVAGVIKSREQIQMLIGVDSKMILVANLC